MLPFNKAYTQMDTPWSFLRKWWIISVFFLSYDKNIQCIKINTQISFLAIFFPFINLFFLYDHAILFNIVSWPDSLFPLVVRLLCG